MQDSGGQTIKDPEQLVIPDKLYFKIGEVSTITEVETHVLRYWESVIKAIRPQRASSKQRLYRREDIEKIIVIKRLLYEDGYTIHGAKKYLVAQRNTKKDKAAAAQEKKEASVSSPVLYKEMKEELEELKKLLET